MCLSPGVSLSFPLQWTHSGPQGNSIYYMSTSKWHSSLSNTCSLIKLLTEAGHTQISFRQALRSNQHCRLRGQIILPPAQSPHKGGNEAAQQLQYPPSLSQCSCWMQMVLQSPPQIFLCQFEGVFFSVSFAKSDLPFACFLVHWTFLWRPHWLQAQQHMIEKSLMCVLCFI